MDISNDTKLHKVILVPGLGDELVPPETTIIHGALNTKIPTVEHMISITSALTIFSKSLIGFLKE